VAGAVVFALAASMADSLDADVDEPLPRAEWRSRTDAKGFYRIEGLQSSKPWTLVVQAPGYSPWKLDCTPAEGENPNNNVVLGPGVTLEGRVVSAAGRGVPGAVVWSWGLVVSESEPPVHRINSSVQTAAMADAEGRFTLSLTERAKTHLYVASTEGLSLIHICCGGRRAQPHPAVRAARRLRLLGGVSGTRRLSYWTPKRGAAFKW